MSRDWWLWKCVNFHSFYPTIFVQSELKNFRQMIVFFRGAGIFHRKVDILRVSYIFRRPRCHSTVWHRFEAGESLSIKSMPNRNFGMCHPRSVRDSTSTIGLLPGSDSFGKPLNRNISSNFEFQMPDNHLMMGYKIAKHVPGKPKSRWISFQETHPSSIQRMVFRASNQFMRVVVVIIINLGIVVVVSFIVELFFEQFFFCFSSIRCVSERLKSESRILPSVRLDVCGHVWWCSNGDNAIGVVHLMPTHRVCDVSSEMSGISFRFISVHSRRRRHHHRCQCFSLLFFPICFISRESDRSTKTIRLIEMKENKKNFLFGIPPCLALALIPVYTTGCGAMRTYVCVCWCVCASLAQIITFQIQFSIRLCYNAAKLVEFLLVCWAGARAFGQLE